MKKLAAIALAASALVALPAAAQTYNFADFGNPVFSYGYGTAGSTFTAFSSTYAGGCQGVAAFSCTTAGGSNALPVIGVNTGASTIHFANTVDLPTDTLFFHPGSAASDSDAILVFTAPTAGVYNITGTFERLDETTNGNGVLLSAFVNNGSAGSYTLNPGAQYTTNVGIGGTLTLAAGGTIVLGVNNNGEYTYDSTGLTGSITREGAVPEPATWAMMLVGFGMVGFGLRYRRNSTKVRFA